MTSFSPEHLRPPWGRVALSRGETLPIRIGPLLLELRAEPGEVWLTHRRDEEAHRREEEAHRRKERVQPGREPIDPGTEPGEWTRWATGDREIGEVELRPSLPDRPVVVEPDQSFHLLPGARARIYVRVPVSVAVVAPSVSPRPLVELPTEQLSDTWWGDFLAGELCYYLPISARRRIGEEHFLPHAAVAPLDLRNRADEDLTVEKLALRVTHLGIFQTDAGLWTDETRVRYRGEILGSDLEMAGHPPEEAGEARGVSAPRTPLARGFRARTFARLRGLGVGG